MLASFTWLRLSVQNINYFETDIVKEKQELENTELHGNPNREQIRGRGVDIHYLKYIGILRYSGKKSHKTLEPPNIHNITLRDFLNWVKQNVGHSSLTTILASLNCNSYWFILFQSAT